MGISDLYSFLNKSVWVSSVRLYREGDWIFTEKKMDNSAI